MVKQRKSASGNSRSREQTHDNGIPHTARERHDQSPDKIRNALWRRKWAPDVQLAAVVSTAVLIVYLKTLHPSIHGGDSGELVTTAHEAGVAHPPGYPLFAMTGKLVIELLPVYNVAWRVNFLTAVYSAAASGLLMLAVLRLTGQWCSGVLAIALFSVSRVTWVWSVSAEVFGLNNLFVALLLVLLVWFESSPADQKLQVARYGALVSGLSLCNQHTIVVYVFAVAVWVLCQLYQHRKLSRRAVLQLGVYFMLGLLPYLYIPIMAHLNPGRWTWGDQRTLSGFLKHLLRLEYGTFSLAKGSQAIDVFQGLSAYLRHVTVELAFVGPILACYGFVVAGKCHRRGQGSALCVISAMLLLYVLLFAWRANLDLSNSLLLGVVERFWIQSNMLVAVLAAVTFNDIFSWLSLRLTRVSSMLQAVTSCCCLLFQLYRNWSLCDQSGNHVVYEFAKTILDSMPSHAIVLTEGDLPSNTLRYLHLCENYRPDLQIMDQEVLTYEWSLPMLGKSYYKLKFPGDFFSLEDRMYQPSGRRSFTFKTLLDFNYDRYPIFGCIGMQDHDPSWKETYELWPFGVCSKFVKKGTALQPESWGKRTGNFALHWTHPYEGLDPKSWEKVASDEMWNAKIITAAFMYDRAMRATDQKDKTALFLQSYKMYFRAMDNNAEYPTFWHKNFALVCQMLTQYEHSMDNMGLMEESIRQFQIYVDETPASEDHQIEDIKKTIKALHIQRDQLADHSVIK